MNRQKMHASPPREPFPGLGLGFFMRRRARAPRRIATLALISGLLVTAGLAALWLV